MKKICLIVLLYIGILISCDSPKEVKQLKSTDPLELEKESILLALEQVKSQKQKKTDSFESSGNVAETAPVYQEFRNPPERVATGGLLNTELEIAYTEQQIWNVKMQKSLTVNLRNYEGMLVGPTLRVRQGDLMRVKMSNQLPPLGEVDCNPYKGHHHTSSADPCDQKNPKTFNTTNLHTHGLHVSPKDSSDNVLASVDPTCSFQNHIQLPRDHPQGTFWYHAHIHGSTAVQVSSGMAGALIVEGGMDTLPEIKAAEEKIFVMQQIPYTQDSSGQWGVENFNASFGPGTWGDGVKKYGWRTIVNGQTYPIITMKSGEVQYWRFVHAGVRETIDLELDGHQLNEIAMDGISLGRIESKGHIELQPGYRSDILVKAEKVTEPKTIFLYDRATQENESLLAETESPAVLAIINILPEEMDMPLPTNEMLAAYPPFKNIPDSELDAPKQEVWFNIDLSGADPCFTVNDKPFSMENPPRKLQLGTASEWVVTSNFVNHPFHIHVNSFEITKVKHKSGEVEVFDPPIWKDTYLIQQQDTVYFRSRYEDYDGEFVLHCHILDHEDQGMMELVEIVDVPDI